MKNDYIPNANEIAIKLFQNKVIVKGFLTIPENSDLIVIFAHGSGSGRFSSRNQAVAKYFEDKGLATLLMDLLTPEEEEVDEITRQYRFDIPMLAERLASITEWAKLQPDTRHLQIGYFGSSTGAAAALIAAAKLGSSVAAVVSRGGRPDLAMQFLSKVVAPSLFIVGGEDYGVIELNEKAFEMLQCKKKLEIVPGATHLFEEPGKLEEVARLAAAWFKNVGLQG